jgi:hypothetical protein|tara:strand:+ start:815 stop:1273 length:459 start_codon:yes stop_codon:yes gene_type:complete
MNIKIFNIKTNVLLLALFVLSVTLISCNLFCGCCSGKYIEQYVNHGNVANKLRKTSVNYNNKQSEFMEEKYEEYGNNIPSMCESNVLEGSDLEPHVPLKEGQLLIWANNEFSKQCCNSSSQYTKGNGCLCETHEQKAYLSHRGGNNTVGEIF